jgi:hypothetical protein
MTAAVAWGHELASHPAASHGSRSHHAKPRTHKRGQRHKASKSTTKKSTRANATIKTSSEATSNAASATTDPALFGDQTVEPTADNNKSGLAEAFPFTGHINGTARSINVYLDSHSTASTVLAAIYADSSGQPGSLLASAKLASPRAGAWNALPISATSVSASKSYWIAVLGKGGTLYFRDRSSGPCRSMNSRQTGLAAMPSAWASGSSWTTCPASAFVAGTATATTTSANPPSDPPPTATTPVGTTTTTSSLTPLPPVPLPPVPLPVPPVNLLAPQISGTTTQGQALTTDNGTWLDGPTSYSYQWEDCNSSGASCANIAGATQSSYTLAHGDVGDTIRVIVTGTNDGGSNPSTSAQTSAVQPLPAPSTTALPSISGTAQQAQALTAGNGSWSGNPSSYSYQWRDCNTSGASCSNISGATSSSHTLTSNEVGDTVRVIVTATNPGGSTPATSAQTAVVQAAPVQAPVNTALPSISGAAQQGQALTAGKGTWSGSPTSYGYQWEDCNTSGATCANIAGATSTSYTLTSNDVGDTVRVIVTATNAGGSTPATSAQTSAVQAPAPPVQAPANSGLPVVSGSAQQGQVLTTSQGTWSNGPTGYGYQWQDCNSSGAGCAAISGATSASYMLTGNDTGHTVRSVVTATNTAGSASATSAQTQAVTAPSATQNCAGTPGSGTVNQASLDACGFPSMNSTGPPAGTAMTSSSGFTASTAGKVYDGLNINGSIYISASNVTIQNSNITDVDKDNAAIQIASGVTGVVIKNDSIHGTNTGQSGALAFAVSYFGNSLSGVTIDHVNFYNGDRILAGYGTVTNSYCLGGANFNNSGGLEHDECIYTDGSAPGIRAQHDTLLVNNGQTAAIFVDNPDFGGGGTNGTLDIENSILAGGGYCIYGGGGRSTAHTGPVTITNNRFTRIFFSDCGQFGPDAYVSNGDTWTGNLWDDTNQNVGS